MASLLFFEDAIATDWPSERWGDLTVVVAVSGGADSVALLRALQRIRDSQEKSREGRLIVAHFNHGWRGEESAADARFVRSLARRLALPVIVGQRRCRESGSGDAGRRKPDEDSARRVRYRFLLDVARRFGARYIATAHTADDQVETVLQRILRGTGLAGLAGIPRVRQLSPAVTLIRPMLQVTRSQVQEYLDLLGQSHREDSTNATRDYVRNRIRQELLPLARELYPASDASIRRLASLAAEAQAVFDRQAERLRSEAVARQSADELVLRLGAAKAADEYLVREMLRSLWQEQRWPLQGMGTKQWIALAQLIAAAPERAGPTAIDLPGGVSAKKQGELLTLTRPAKKDRGKTRS